jgi:hypothetical protein
MLLSFGLHKIQIIHNFFGQSIITLLIYSFLFLIASAFYLLHLLGLLRERTFLSKQRSFLVYSSFGLIFYHFGEGVKDSDCPYEIYMA